MTITAKLIAASRSAEPSAPPLVTMEIRYPRFIHAEAKTHRVMRIDDAEYEFLQEISLMDDPDLSRNASSSRATPVKKMIQDVLDDPAMPVRWGANQPGMQDAGDHDTTVVWADHTGPSGNWGSPKDAWLKARDHAVAVARGFADAGYHKQVVNRLLEPFAHITVIVTATEWLNFFDLRCHEAADPTMRALAEAMKEVFPFDADLTALDHREWHLPYVTEQDLAEQGKFHKTNADYRLRLISAARCARVSYLNHDGSEPDAEKDIELAKRLLSDRHMSPFEHQGRPDVRNHSLGWNEAQMHGNLRGWVQSRKLFEQEFGI